jgi:hypothetical protein
VARSARNNSAAAQSDAGSVYPVVRTIVRDIPDSIADAACSHADSSACGADLAWHRCCSDRGHDVQRRFRLAPNASMGPLSWRRCRHVPDRPHACGRLVQRVGRTPRGSHSCSHRNVRRERSGLPTPRRDHLGASANRLENGRLSSRVTCGRSTMSARAPSAVCAHASPCVSGERRPDEVAREVFKEEAGSHAASSR